MGVGDLVGVGVGDLVGVGVGDLVGVGVGVDGVQAVMSVVQAAPAAGQQYWISGIGTGFTCGAHCISGFFLNILILPYKKYPRNHA
ncbi:MAG: hypothetical protein UU12_C0020G0012 [Candidatus Woesebacteria bacterium GW2011_GWA2_40_7b]|uniref:Uncharacterized protein n=1 Tax=Candidatus Woesebacteria bacterium GW2011_GWA2_40_7b TaxID=1618563 RepID=A0A0G0T6X2_9BACT|nr:MAG: hypothetical protein UU12_C0020G0012 [Candidatus Woesebacteria bacterium GW2011_GWA2_40_7b]